MSELLCFLVSWGYLQVFQANGTVWIYMQVSAITMSDNDQKLTKMKKQKQKRVFFSKLSNVKVHFLF